MDRNTRHNKIISRLEKADSPVSAGILAKELGISRQIIVQDIALLRASGYNVSSLSRGYMLDTNKSAEKIFKVIHSDEDTQKELNLIVDLGGTVKDVFVYHKIYGKVSAVLNIKSRYDVKNFINNISEGKSSLLKNVTSSFHYHTVSAENIETLDLIEKELDNKGFLAPLKEYEPF